MSTHQEQEDEERQPLLGSENTPNNKNGSNPAPNDDDNSQAQYGSVNAPTDEKETTEQLPVQKESSPREGAEADEASPTEGEKKKDDDEESEDAKPSDKYKLSPEERAAKRIFWFTVTIVSYVVLVAAWVALFLTKSVSFDFTEQVLAYPINESLNMSEQPVEFLTAYNVKHSVADLFIVDCARAVPMIIFFFIMRGRPAGLHPYTFHYSTFFWFVVTAKAWTFQSWHQIQVVAMLISLVTCTITLYAHNQIYNCDVPPDMILKFSGFRKVMGPYIAPSGKWNRAVVFSMWFIVAASKASTLVAPIILGNAVSHITHRDLHNAAIQLIIYGVLQLIPTLLESIQDTVSAYVWMAAYREVAENAFVTVLSLDLHWHLTKKLGGVMRSIDRGMNSAERLMSWVLMWAVPNVGSGALSFIIFAVHFRQPELAAICWLSLCLYIWVTVLITKIRRKFNEQQNVHDNDANANSTDTLVAIEVVKSFTNEDSEIKRYIDEIKKMQTFNYKGQVFTAAVNTSQGTVIQLCTVTTLILAGIHAVHNTPIDGLVEIGTFVAISQYLSNLFAPLSFIGSLYSMTITALVNVQNLAEIMEEKPELQDRPDAVEFRSRFPKIVSGDDNNKNNKDVDGISVEFEDVYFHYPTQDADKGLQGVSFKMEPGTTTALVGTTGSGKTTLGSKLLFGFFEPQRGSIKFNGVDRKEFTAISLRREIGMVPQDTTLFNNTLKYNIAYGRLDATDEEIDEAVRIAQLPPTLERLSKGLETVVGERGARLSGGERQRVAIARCVLKNPSICCFDESTASLDNETERKLQEALDTLSGGRRTSLVIAHRLTTIQNADQIIVLEKGRIVEKGNHRELLELKGQYSKMWNAQKKAVEEEEKKRQESSTVKEGSFEAATK